jgi:hypothetical protein
MKYELQKFTDFLFIFFDDDPGICYVTNTLPITLRPKGHANKILRESDRYYYLFKLAKLSVIIPGSSQNKYKNNENLTNSYANLLLIITRISY